MGVGRMRSWRWVLEGSRRGGCWKDEVMEVGVGGKVVEVSVGRMRSWRW